MSLCTHVARATGYYCTTCSTHHARRKTRRAPRAHGRAARSTRRHFGPSEQRTVTRGASGLQ
eukprot:1276970-Alexandrium_andersonii.AAC.1